MRNRKTTNYLIIMLCAVSHLGFTFPVGAGGMAVIDVANIKQTTITAIESVEQTLKQIEEYKTQLMQYENMIRNTLAPPAYLWAQAQNVMFKLIHLTNTIRFYEQQYGSLDGYMQRFRNVDYYRASPCFNLQDKCNDAAWTLLQDGQRTSTEAQKKANDSLLIGLGEHPGLQNAKSWRNFKFSSFCKVAGKKAF